MYAHPGRKLMFMGCEWAQVREWNHDAQLDWQLLDQSEHVGVQRLVRDLNHLYRDHAALHARDDEPEGFRWLEVEDRAHSVFSFVRFATPGEPPVVAVCNLTPVVRHGYRLGVPQDGVWQEILNTDATYYGGSGVGNGGTVVAEPVHSHGHDTSVVLTLPPLGVLWLKPEHMA